MNFREIKFRGKRADTNEWVFGYYLKTEKSNPIMFRSLIYSDEYGRFLIEPETVGQYIGLKDKNGKEIYEGDIVETENEFNLIKRIEIKYCVETLSFLPTNFVGSISEYCVIGNIHENPGLLEVSK